ncbi:CENP-B homolog protein 2-like protein [Tanacetum coccineum]|uniref:CENP-B homolog protein 2-like protein n=1 Tax=Tanacetum coccineum TaxID=301880 RepID=A0ABQ5CKG1_9ASTR
MTQAAIRQLIVNGITAALEAQAATMANTNRNAISNYKGFMNCSILPYFDGKEELLAASMVSQPTISNTVKRSLEYLSLAPERGDVKRHKPAKFPDLEKSLYEWILQYQEHVNMTGELIIEKAKKFMKDMYPVDTPDFTFSIGWLGKFKARYGIKNFRRFGESGSVEMEGMEDKLKSIRDKVDQFEMKDHI